MRLFFDLVALISKFVQPLLRVYSESILSPIFQVAVPPPTLAQRASILSAVASEMHLAENLDVSSLAASTEGWSGAEVAAILRDAAAAAIRENADAQCIETRHVHIAR
jgi:SpoVK/Ycf46/Vps4 family AAA+-type ATPase